MEQHVLRPRIRNNPRTEMLSSRLSLLELIATIIIIVTLAGLIAPLFGNAALRAEDDARALILIELRASILGGSGQQSYKSDTLKLPPQLIDLFLYRDPGSGLAINPDTNSPYPPPPFDPVRKLGWRGPYADISKVKIDPVALTVTDLGGQLILLQYPNTVDSAQRDMFARLIHSGPNGLIDCSPDALSPENLSPESRSDDTVLFLFVSDPHAPSLGLENRESD